MTAPVDPRDPVLVGVGTATQDAGEPGRGAEALELMIDAARAAAADAGAPHLLARLGRVLVPKGTWGYADAGRLVAERLGAAGARTTLAEVGVPQQTLVSAALRAIGRGEVDAALVVGGEAKRRAVTAQRAGAAAAETVQGDAVPDEHLHPQSDIVHPAEIRAGAWDPVQQYALMENALRAAEGQTLDDHLDAIADLWAGFSRVAAANPQAAFPEPRSASFLRVPGPENRLLAFPYAKWHSTQWTVDQAAALLLCSAEAARAHGVPLDRWLFPRVALESSHAVPLSARHDLHRWPAMRLLGEAAAAHLGRPLAEVEHAELYSCFPVAVRIQQRELGLPLDGVPTVTGGMAFAGGPFNNFTYQATAAIAGRLRDEPGSLGMVTTVSGLLTKPGLMVWATEPGALRVDDLAGAAARATVTVDGADGYGGPATIASYTVTPGDRVVVIADAPDGRRCVVTIDDPALAERGMTEELVASKITVTADGRGCP